VLFWLNLLAVRRESVEEIVQAHWREFGRNFYTRYDYEGIDTAAANGLMTHLQARLAELPGSVLEGYTVEYADNFAYTDPVDGVVSENQGIRIGFTDGSRIVLRLSGTGTEGATLRIYLEAYEPDPEKQNRETAGVMQPLVDIATGIAEIEARTGRAAPTVIT
jgi:phosphoglucomutase